MRENAGGYKPLVAAFVFTVLLLTLKMAPVPAGVYIVASSSMEPALDPFDIIVVNGKDIHVGDVVVWCISPLFCVAHRVVEIRGPEIITKGDANPFHDPPIPYESVKGKVVARIPWFSWLSTATVLTLALVFFKRRALSSVASTLASGWGAMIVLAGLYIMLSFAAMMITAGNVIGTGDVFRQPVIKLARVDLVENGTMVRLEYSSSEPWLSGVVSCTFVSPVEMPCNATVVNGRTVYVDLPVSEWKTANTEGEYIQVRFNASLTVHGELVGRPINITVNVKPLDIKVNGYRLVITNNNPFPVDLNITVYYSDEPGPWKIFNRTAEAEAYSTTIIGLDKHRYEFVEVKYILWGETVRQVLRVNG